MRATSRCTNFINPQMTNTVPILDQENVAQILLDGTLQLCLPVRTFHLLLLAHYLSYNCLQRSSARLLDIEGEPVTETASLHMLETKVAFAERHCHLSHGEDRGHLSEGGS